MLPNAWRGTPQTGQIFAQSLGDPAWL